MKTIEFTAEIDKHGSYMLWLNGHWFYRNGRKDCERILPDCMWMFEGLKPGESRTVKFVEAGGPAFWICREPGDNGVMFYDDDGVGDVVPYELADVSDLDPGQTQAVYLGDPQPLPREPAETEIFPGQKWKDSRGVGVVADFGKRWKLIGECDGNTYAWCITKNELQTWLNENCTPVED